MDIKLIKTEKDYYKALKRLDEVFDSPAKSPEYAEAEILELLIENYENEHYPIDTPDPIEAIKFRMEQMGWDNNDLAEVIGYKSRISELFNHKRKLTLKMIKNLHEKLNIPYECLIPRSA
ncbi:MAG: helix-turn-helix domain-containing protein [Bacteroidetes bacterium]|nr:helix-turn-helix domain-containing protein [Bacteroidota bacterium]